MSDKTKTIERNVVIKDINIHIKSVFGDKIPLTKALTNDTRGRFSCVATKGLAIANPFFIHFLHLNAQKKYNQSQVLIHCALGKFFSV